MKKKGLFFMLTIMALSCFSCNSNSNEASTETTQNIKEIKKEEAAKKERLTPVPNEYLTKIEEAGTVTLMEYESTQADGSVITKKAYVYLPYGYDETQKYDIIYCLHGGEGNTQAYLGAPNGSTKVRNLLDNMIKNGDIEPVIAVAPTYYIKKSDGSNMGVSVARIEHFTEKELINDLIPAVESTYSTYAETTDLEGIKASREHRAYTGFSMGSLSTWYTFINASDYFYYYMPMSGDCWVNGSSNASGAANMLEKLCIDKAYGENDFFIYAVTGSDDIAYSGMNSQIKAMKANSPSFKFLSRDSLTGNICFHVEPDATHSYIYLPLYFYNGLPLFFGK